MSSPSEALELTSLPAELISLVLVHLHDDDIPARSNGRHIGDVNDGIYIDRVTNVATVAAHVDRFR